MIVTRDSTGAKKISSRWNESPHETRFENDFYPLPEFDESKKKGEKNFLDRSFGSSGSNLKIHILIIFNNPWHDVLRTFISGSGRAYCYF